MLPAGDYRWFFFPSLSSHVSIYDIAFRRCSLKELKEKTALQALDSFHALCANTVKPTSSPQSVGKGRLKAQEPITLPEAVGWTKPPQRNTKGSICRGSPEQSGKYLDPEVLSTPPAAPSSILFILQRGDLAGKVNFPSSPSVLPAGPALLSTPSSESYSSCGRRNTQEKSI